jgi:group I intron endonuclease
MVDYIIYEEVGEGDCFGIIYKITNKINGKIYIGATKKGVQWRWSLHIKDAIKKPIMKISKAIAKYGKDNFYVDIIDCCHDLDNMNEQEKYWIKEFNSCETGYNSSLGGNNQGPISDEIREKIKTKQKEFWLSPKSEIQRQKLKGHFKTNQPEQKQSKSFER